MPKAMEDAEDKAGRDCRPRQDSRSGGESGCDTFRAGLRRGTLQGHPAHAAASGRVGNLGVSFTLRHAKAQQASASFFSADITDRLGFFSCATIILRCEITVGRCEITVGRCVYAEAHYFYAVALFRGGSSRPLHGCNCSPQPPFPASPLGALTTISVPLLISPHHITTPLHHYTYCYHY